MSYLQRVNGACAAKKPLHALALLFALFPLRDLPLRAPLRSIVFLQLPLTALLRSIQIWHDPLDNKVQNIHN